jgi:hypothetical protein
MQKSQQKQFTLSTVCTCTSMNPFFPLVGRSFILLKQKRNQPLSNSS